MCKPASKKTEFANLGLGNGLTLGGLFCKSVSEPGGNLGADSGKGLTDHSPTIPIGKGHRHGRGLLSRRLDWRRRQGQAACGRRAQMSTQSTRTVTRFFTKRSGETTLRWCGSL